MGAKGLWGAAAGAVLLLAALLFVVLSGSGQGEAPAGVPLGQEGEELLLFAEGDAGPYVVYRQGSGGFFLRADPSTGDTARAESSGPVLGAACQGGLLFIFREDGPFLSVEGFNKDLEKQGTYDPPLLREEILLFDYTSQGTVYIVPKADPSTLTLYKLGNSMWTKTFPGKITWMEVAPDGSLWLYAGDILYRGGSLAPDSLEPVTGGAPRQAVSSDAYIGEDGFLWRVKDGQAEPALEGPFSPFLCCACEGGLLHAGSGGLVTRRLWDGSAAGTCRVAGEVVALTEKSVLYRADGQVFCAALSFREDEPTPSTVPSPSLQPEESASPEPSQPEEPVSPGPSISPSSLPSPSPSPGLPDVDLPGFRDGYMFVSESMTLTRLRELFKPQELSLYTASGKPVAEGRLATGMRAVLDQEYLLVVRGDCDGSGAVNSRDVLRGQEILLQGSGSTQEVFFLAADVDSDGEVTTNDLLWIAGHST